MGDELEIYKELERDLEENRIGEGIGECNRLKPLWNLIFHI